MNVHNFHQFYLSAEVYSKPSEETNLEEFYVRSVITSPDLIQSNLLWTWHGNITCLYMCDIQSYYTSVGVRSTADKAFINLVDELSLDWF